jgi:hypothetical protein
VTPLGPGLEVGWLAMSSVLALGGLRFGGLWCTCMPPARTAAHWRYRIAWPLVHIARVYADARACKFLLRAPGTGPSPMQPGSPRRSAICRAPIFAALGGGWSFRVPKFAALRG